jgi:hypothetical protein
MLNPQARAAAGARPREIAHAVMHTTGQTFVMSFQAGCPQPKTSIKVEVVTAMGDRLRFCGEARVARSAYNLAGRVVAQVPDKPWSVPYYTGC